MQGSLRILVLATAFLVLQVAQAAQAAELTIAGSTTVSSSVLDPYEEKIEKRAGVDLRVNAIGSSRGIVALSDGLADIAAISAPLADVVRKINSREPGKVDGRSLVAHEIGAASVAFIVHPSNPIKELSFEKITDILAGRIKFWSELGGPNERIEIIAEYKGGGIRTMVEKKIGEWGDVLVDDVNSVQTGPQVTYAVGVVPNAIGIVATAMVNNSVFMMRTDQVITQPMFLVTKGEPSREVAKVIEAVRQLAGGAKGGA